MKTVTAYECDHCGRYKKTKKSIKDHEPICFKNPESKSCITCEHLCQKGFVRNMRLTDQEEKILNFEVEGTFYEYGSDEDGSPCIQLNEEYEYLNYVEYDNFCGAKSVRLTKLTTKCP